MIIQFLKSQELSLQMQCFKMGLIEMMRENTVLKTTMNGGENGSLKWNFCPVFGGSEQLNDHGMRLYKAHYH